MGWSSANAIFDPVARALQDASTADDDKRKTLGDLITGLQGNDWDTEDESLEKFLDDPAIVSAFADHGVHLSDRRCCARELGVGPRRALLLMRREEIDEGLMEQALDAYAHHLAESIRNTGMPEDSVVFTEGVRWAADHIDPHPGQSRTW